MFALTTWTAFSFSVAQPENSVTIKFDRLELLKSGWSGRQFYFKINGTVFSPDNKLHEIKISKNSIDSVAFSFDSTFQNTETCLTKFKAGQTYLIKINPCSQYELVADNNAKTGQVRFKTINNNDTLIAFLNHSFATDTLVGNDITEYRQNYPSGNCYFAPTEIYLADKGVDDSEPINSDKIRAKVSFHFLQGEKLTVTYDGSTKKITTTVDGYAE